ncbi:Protein C02F5.7 b [Aphelenchoides avenae]|nr:Protein C02F5.7 b [Aphelenchus avenae]
MRLTSRKRHVVVASANGPSLQLTHHPDHPTIQAKQNQMYLITTLHSSQSNQQALINRVLPKELILRVFSYLDIVSLCRCAQTCRCWNKLAMDGSNWQDVDLFDFQKGVKPAVVESLAKRCGGFLKNLSLKGCENMQDHAMRSFAAKCPNIERLILFQCKLITDAEGCKRLEELNVSWCSNLTDLSVNYIANGCPKLQALICKGLQGLSPNCFDNVNNNHFQELRKLNLLSCPNVTDETVEHIASHCHKLEYVCLSNCKEITDRALQALAIGCVNLKDLELAACANVTDVGFVSLSKNCHELERMDLEDCVQITDATLTNLNAGCPNLTSMSLSHCENLTDAALAELCATHKERLQILELDNCPSITDAALDYMMPLCKLERIDLYDCQNITKDAIKKFKSVRPEVDVHAYFAPATPPGNAPPQRQGICRCCVIL